MCLCDSVCVFMCVLCFVSACFLYVLEIDKREREVDLLLDFAIVVF